jgi:hypothetical protein
VGLCAKECSADADHGGSLFDGDGVVVGHAHGEVLKAVAADLAELEFFEDFAEADKDGAGVFGVGGVGGHAHEADEVAVVHGVDLLGEVDCGADGDSELGAFAGDVDFEENGHDFLEAFGFVLDFLGKAEGIDTLDGFAELHDGADFVALEVADHVPADVAGGGEFFLTAALLAKKPFFDLGGALLELLDAGFGQFVVAPLDELFDLVGGAVLGDGDESDGLGIAARLDGGGSDGVVDFFEAVLEIHGASSVSDEGIMRGLGRGASS